MIRSSRFVSVAAILAGVLLLTADTHAGDWPGWLGPSQDGSAPDEDVFTKGETAPTLEVTWTAISARPTQASPSAAAN